MPAHPAYSVCPLPANRRGGHNRAGCLHLQTQKRKRPCFCALSAADEHAAMGDFRFMKRDTCIDHMKNYTFSVTWKRGPQQARKLANLCGPLFSRLVRSTGAIPVYRNSLQVRETFRQSIDALSAGSSLLIFPDVDYSRESGDIDALYDGFLLLEQLWHRRTGEHIRFVPVNVSLTKKTIVIGKSISFSDKLSFHEEKSLVAKRLQDTLNQMAREYGA